MKRMWLFVFGLAIGGLTSCRPGSPPEMPSTLIDCGVRAVQSNWPRAFPHVQRCLSVAMSTPMQCLDALPTLLGVGLDVVACVVRASGQEAASQQSDHPEDVLSMRRLERSRAWLESRKIDFK